MSGRLRQSLGRHDAQDVVTRLARRKSNRFIADVERLETLERQCAYYLLTTESIFTFIVIAHIGLYSEHSPPESELSDAGRGERQRLRSKI